ncbi:farnesyl-protein transferase beta subunit [Theileria orientalis strain Shintoku]|uniref:Farnesyl-protein transferase beta subunit n=1 Tax=Theileria orientalis strain Shintoku TaxID=869250 RepID=J4CD43_THEOR|nr:farnesyl-protein transferase beta subunit [Theileria orientalis strain Shintoku]BAM40492.1 farnesyl-protein transferase beta subunit [Theileria orientalis strain Shintoku]|eukprot:XP_009690793.1 farnesyl-protein transferase beta subunit [Theileria orientalis strain Shintoku]
MDYLRNKHLNRVEKFLFKLNNVILLVIDGESSSEKDEEDLSPENEEYIIDYVSELLIKYVVSVCEDDDLSENKGSENIEESVESQKLVEHDCNEVYSSRIALALKNLISSGVTLRSFDRMTGANMFGCSEESTRNVATKGGSLNANSRTGCESDKDGSVKTKSNESVLSKLGELNEEAVDDPDELVYSKTEVSNLLKFRVCRLVLEFISDVPEFVQGNYVGIRYTEHGQHVLRRFCHLCVSVSPFKSERHLRYLKGHLSCTGPTKMINLGYLDSSRPWIVYWALHSLCLLGEDIVPYKERYYNAVTSAVQTLLLCWDEERGGFGGGRFQRGHVATSYAAICVLRMLHSLHEVDTRKLHSFLMDMKLDSGAFTTTYGGEYDTRSTYCAVACASMTGLLTEELARNTAEFVQSCQTYEGGIAAEPGLEAHAGYTYCGVACLALLGQLHRLNLNKLHYWAVRRVTSQFGFQGRPHKLVDSCYSFWIGAVLHIVSSTSGTGRADELIQLLTRCYVLAVAQTGGGFRDKPNKSPDLYHTCYSLSYLNIVSPIAKHRHDVLLNVLEL